MIRVIQCPLDATRPYAPPLRQGRTPELSSVIGGLVLPLRIEVVVCVVAVIIVIDVHSLRLVVPSLFLSGQQYCSMLPRICVARMRRVSISNAQVS
jgi:hypothetical protein